MQNGMMLDLGGDQMLFPFAGGAIENPFQGHVVGLGAAAGEKDLLGLGADDLSHLLPGLLYGDFGFPAQIIQGGGIAVFLFQIRQHGVQHLGSDAGRGCVICINKHVATSFLYGFLQSMMLGCCAKRFVSPPSIYTILVYIATGILYAALR